MNLWIFGHSACTRHGLNKDTQSWMDIIQSTKRVAQTSNFAEEGSDNLRIYNNIIANIDKISNNDIVIVGWSHPSRKSFVLDKFNQTHLDLLNQDVIVYTGEPTFFRSKNPIADTWSIGNIQSIGEKHKITKGKIFFDNWFYNYYAPHESKLNFQSYLDSTSKRLNCSYLPFFFSEDSISGIQTDKTVFYLDYILQSKNYIDKNDLHLNDLGHKQFAQLLLQQL